METKLNEHIQTVTDLLSCFVRGCVCVFVVLQPSRGHVKETNIL